MTVDGYLRPNFSPDYENGETRYPVHSKRRRVLDDRIPITERDGLAISQIGGTVYCLTADVESWACHYTHLFSGTNSTSEPVVFR